jgi:hypothetical protein
VSARKEKHRDDYNRKQRDVVHPRLEAERDARRFGKSLGAQHAAQKNRIGRGQSRAKYRRRRFRQAEQQPCGEGSDDSGNERAGSEKSPEHARPRPELLRVERDGVAEEQQCQPEHRERVESGRFEPDVRDAESPGADRGAEEEKNRCEGETASLDRAREKGRDDDDDADQRD